MQTQSLSFSGHSLLPQQRWEKRVTLQLLWCILIRTQVSEREKNHLHWIWTGHEEGTDLTLQARTQKQMQLQTPTWQSLVQRDEVHGVSVLSISLSALILFEHFHLYSPWSIHFLIPNLLINSPWDKRELTSLVWICFLFCRIRRFQWKTASLRKNSWALFKKVQKRRVSHPAWPREYLYYSPLNPAPGLQIFIWTVKTKWVVGSWKLRT